MARKLCGNENDRGHFSGSGRPPVEDAPGLRALPPLMRRPIGTLVVLAAFVVAVFGVAYSGDAHPGRIDQWLDSAVEAALPPAGSGALLIDFVAEPVGATVLMPVLAALCLTLGRRRLAMLAVVGPGLSVLVTTAIKPAVGRTINGGYLAYPSGHTAFATALALVLGLLLVSLMFGKPGGVALVLGTAGAAGAAMAWSQIALGAHYPTDTLGGFCIAVAMVPTTAWLVDRLADRGARLTARRASPGYE